MLIIEGFVGFEGDGWILLSHMKGETVHVVALVHFFGGSFAVW
jgi:hypothetical protein